MKILLITRYFPPLESVATLRMVSFAKTWAELGHEVHVLTTKKPKAPSIPNITVHEVDYMDPLGSGAGNNQGTSYLLSFYRRRMNERMPNRTDHWTLNAKKALSKFSSFDLVVSSYGPYTAHLVGMEAQKKFKAFWVADFRDLWTDNHTYKGLFPFTLLEKFLENKIMQRANLVTTVSKGLKDRLLKKYPKACIEVVRNGFSSLPLRYPGKEIRPFHFLYCGTIFESGHDYKTLEHAFKNIEATLEYIGTHPNPPQTKNCYYSGKVTPEESLMMQSIADAFVLIDFKKKDYEGLIGTKVYEYLCAQKPILAVDVNPNSELGELLIKSGGALLCSYSEIEAAAKKIMRGEFPPHNIDVIKGFDRSAQAETIIEFSQRTMSTS